MRSLLAVLTPDLPFGITSQSS